MKEPGFWQADANSPLHRAARFALSPLAAIYGWAGARRIAKTEPVDPGIPVICVGNITLGGTGKTPITQTILKRLSDMSVTAHTLSRGYGGKEKGPLRVDPNFHNATQVGDEPLLLARTAPVWVSRDRPAGAKQAAKSGAQMLVMDDGHQNPTLKKHLSICVIDGVAGWGANRVFPAGPLREQVAHGLARADAVIVIMPDDQTTPDYEGLCLADLEIPILHAWLAPTQTPPKEPLVAFAGIGRPAKVFDSLTAAGANLVGTRAFPDHHPYTTLELAALHDLARTHKARLITTEKDWVRLPVEMQGEIEIWPIHAQFANPAALDALLESLVDTAVDAAAAGG
jgi:tetraacyldisaccharide 4'-kinase